MSVKRYWQDTSDDWREVGESPEGDFVLWADYDTLAARLAKAEAALREQAEDMRVMRLLIESEFGDFGPETLERYREYERKNAALADEPQKSESQTEEHNP